MNSDDVSVLDTEILANNSIYPSTAIVQIIIGQHNQDGILSLLSLDENCITTDQLEGLHGVVGKGDHGVVIAGGIGDAEIRISMDIRRELKNNLHQTVWLLFLLEDGGSQLILRQC
jgi:hypothetical protein